MLSQLAVAPAIRYHSKVAMPKHPSRISIPSPDDNFFAAKQRKPIPYEFVLDYLAPLSPRTRPMFGCLAVYIGDKIIGALRDKAGQNSDNGLWLATSEEHHQSLHRDFPHMRSIQVFGKPVTSWQVLPADSSDFEESALRACELIRGGDPRIGKVPKARTARGAQRKSSMAQR